MPRSFVCSGICLSTPGVRPTPGQIASALTGRRAILRDHPREVKRARIRVTQAAFGFEAIL